MTETLIVHDGRVPGGVGAVVLARLLVRSGRDSVRVKYLDSLVTAHDFWTREVSELIASGRKEIRLILFGITFYDLDAAVAQDALDRLKAAYGVLEVWSHRWPDGYSQAIGEVRIPPDDIVYGNLGFLLTPPEKHLLRLSLVAAGAIPVTDHPLDRSLASKLNSWVEADPHNWDVLFRTEQLDEVLLEVQRTSEPSSMSRFASVVVQQDNYVDIEIDAGQLRYELPIIDDMLNERSLNRRTVVLAWLGEDRLVMCRRDPSLSLPSLRWLIENRFQSLVPPELRSRAYGPQDAVYFRLPGASHLKATLRPALHDLAKELANSTTGGRYLTAALARDVAGLANRVFKSIDLTGGYTSGDLPRIEVAAADIYDLFHTSSRTGHSRTTLTMPIRVRGPEAIAFVHRDGGYNLEKAERMLEGALIGLNARGVDWLGLPRQSERLRLDVQPMLSDAGDMQLVREALAAPRIRSVSSTGLVSKDSLIGKFLSEQNLDKLVTLAESETIGPSVAHALTLKAAGVAVAEAPPVRILDLFAGSGVAHRLLASRGFHVTSVDLYVSASSVGLTASEVQGGLWLRADAKAVIDPVSPLVEQNFDVIGLDPPHSELVELLFGAEATDPLVKLCARRSDLLVLYQGHSTQRGRLSLVMGGLGEAGWHHRAVLQVEEELIVVASTGVRSLSEFDELVRRILEDVQAYLRSHQMTAIRAIRLNLPQLSI